MTPAPPLSIREALERDLARGTSDLPTLPRGVADALRLARKPTLDFLEIEAAANAYPPLAARLLAVANSALYASRAAARTASVRRASIRLGIQATRDVLYQVAYATMFVDAPRFRELIEASFQRGVRAAHFGRKLADGCGIDRDLAFLSGLLHDIGRARGWKLVAGMRGRVDVAEAEAAVDAVHAEAGAELAAAWRLPDEVVEACRWHHDPQDRVYPRLAAGAAALAMLEEHAGDEARTARVAEARAALTLLGVPEADAEEIVALALEGQPRDARSGA